MSDYKNFEVQYDMIIVGGGACGLTAAVEAGQNGLNVVVIEKRHSTGGNAMFADGMLAAGSQVQKKQLLDVTPDAILQSAMEYSHQALNARVLRAFINKTADNIRWLEGMGVEFHVDPYIPGQVLLTYHIPKGRMKEVMRILKDKIVDLGVPVITDTQVTEILKNEAGEVVGVKAKDIEKEFVLHSNNVLICTGGYSGNKEMLRKYFPFDSKDLICWGLHHNGDGINMVTEVGGANEGLGILCLSGPHVPATVKAKIDIPNEDPCYIAVSALGREPTGVWVNRRGERYVAEQIGLNGHESPNAVIRQPGQLSFALFDSNTIQEMEEHGLIKGLNQDTRNKNIERSHLPGLAHQLRMQTEGWIYGEISDPDKCVGCGICVMNCAAGAIKLDTIHAEKNEFSACRYACPLHTDMRSYNHLLRMGRKKEAIEKLKEFHPLPAVTGRICPHFCESECARCDVDQAVNIHQVERFLADEMLKEKPQKVPDTHKERIAIIGSGPSGLSCAYFLKRAGYPVTVFEAMEEPGGMLLNGIPEFRLPKDIVHKQIAYIEGMGVEFRCGCEVGRNVTIEELRGQGYKCFHVAVGLQDGGKLGIPGDDAEGVISGIDFSKRVNLQGERNLQGKVVVIGGGNIAADVARTAVRCGAKNVDLYCLEGYDEMPMGQEDRTDCEKDGIAIHPGWGQTEVIAPGGKCKGIKFHKCISVRGEAGRFAPKFDDTEIETRECDTVLYCIGQKVNWGNLLDGTAVEFNPNGTAKGDELTFQTGEKDIFVGGDAYLGQKFVVHALATGKENAISIDRYLRGKDLSEGRDTPICKVQNPPHDNMPLLVRNDVPDNINSGDSLIHNFCEVKGGFTGQQVSNEVNRCMTCGSRSVYSYSDDCQLCRSCEENCPTKAVAMKPLYKMERPLVKIADTWDEIAGYIGCKPEKLKETVAEWNESCAHGKDDLFVKKQQYMRPLLKGPFYCIQSRVAFLTTIGGIKINEHTQVVDKDGEPIPGLYAGGIDTGGWETDTYNVVLSGSTMGFSVASGRIAVHEVMKRLGKE